MTNNRRLFAILLSLAAAAAMAGCRPLGYTAESQYRTGIRTVYVPMVTRGSNVYRRELEMRLTEGIQKHIELSTPYKITKKERADTQLTATIERVNQNTLSMNPDTGFPREVGVKFYVSYRWEDLRTGDVIKESKNFTAAGVYHPTAPFNQDFFRGSERIIDKLARRLVEQMAADW
jgi:hypothetical protein